MSKVAVIRIRGKVRIDKEIKDTLDMLRLFRQNYCVVKEATPSIMGMILKVKDYVTWGTVDEETEKLLNEKKLQKGKDKTGKEVVKQFFRLNPPKGGFERGGIKKPFKMGGALGDRAEKVNDLIKKMI